MGTLSNKYTCNDKGFKRTKQIIIAAIALVHCSDPFGFWEASGNWHHSQRS